MVMDPASDAVFFDHPNAPSTIPRTNTNPIPPGSATALDIAHLATAAITQLYPEPLLIRDITFTPDRRLFAIASDDTVYELDPDTGQILQQTTIASCTGSEDRVTYDPIRGSLFTTSNCSGLSEIKIGTPDHRTLEVVASKPGLSAGGRITADGAGGIYFADGPWTIDYDIANGTSTTLEADGPGPNRWGAAEAVAPVVGAGSRPQTSMSGSRASTVLTYSGPTSANVGSTVTLSATLSEASGPAAMAGAPSPSTSAGTRVRPSPTSPETPAAPWKRCTPPAKSTSPPPTPAPRPTSPRPRPRHLPSPNSPPALTSHRPARHSSTVKLS